MNKEIWKDLPGFEDKVKISTIGRIIIMNFKNTGKSKLINPIPDKRSGHLRFTFRYNNKDVYFSVHTAVAIAFIENDDPVNKIIVHHIDGNPTNNSIENLIWVTKEQHRFLHGQKPIACYNKEGKLVKVYVSIQDTKIDGHHPAHVNYCCNEKYGFRSHHGLIWKFITIDEFNKYKKTD